MVDLQKFVELANKYAPELGATEFEFEDGWVGLRLSEYLQDADFYSNARFTLALLEYLKGRLQHHVVLSTFKDIALATLLSELLAKHWLCLTPEAVIEACIDYWEAME
jgi:hypothetical protein